MGRSLVQRSPTECGVSECDREASIMRRPWPIGGRCATGGKKYMVPTALSKLFCFRADAFRRLVWRRLHCLLRK
jgi:hypothetical protein